MIIIRDLLSRQDLAQVNEAVRSAQFIDGGATANVTSEIKRNLEMEVGEAYVRLVQLLERALRSSAEVEDQIFPRYMTRPIVNRYDVGMFYREHTDAPIQGKRTQFGPNLGPFGLGFVRTDFSATLFLSDPASYDGGELNVTVSGETRHCKLPAGSAVFYPTGLPHSVSPVTRGSRLAAIVWIQSMIRDPDKRRIVSNARHLQTQVHGMMPGSRADQLAVDHYNDLLRLFAEL
jgi:PKHD-type hydroxylase